MNLTKNQKVLVGILHFLPVIGLITYFVFLFSFIFGNIQNLEHHSGKELPIEFFKDFLGAFIVIMLTVLISIGVKVFDIIHLTKSNKNDTKNKILMWILLFVFAGTIAEIVYYFLEILPEKKENNTDL
ncbi:hypothetical protein [Flavobacterium sp.]|uniref:hypothetical protein n=1 Tax=Flavobacterium sp. TaxID=239 RepID=UPI00262C3C70|nr:hypothetical protein [Flavobacterium sp.]